MKITKVLIATVLVTVLNVVIAMVTCGGYFNWVYKLEPVNVWKSMENFSFPLMLLANSAINLIFVIVYALINKGIPGKGKLSKGFVYGLIVWAVGVIPGMIMTALFMTVSPVVVIYWTVLDLIINPLKGLVAAAIYGDE